MISDERAEKALAYLVKTDQEAAAAKAHVIAMEQQTKTVKAMQFLEAEGTVAEREARAATSRDYLAACQKHHAAVADYELLKNKRLSESLVIEAWRSIQANRRHGNV